MNNIPAMKNIDRFIIAAEALLTGPVEPEFANDGLSVGFVAGPADNAASLGFLSDCVLRTGADIVCLEFANGRERQGPLRVVVLAERGGLVYRWTDCALWAPLDEGPLLIMPRGLNVCFAYDGHALVSHQARPTRAIGEGVARARSRLQRAAREVTDEELAEHASHRQPMAA